MKKNQVLPYNKDAKAFQGTERAQSDSSLEIYANCPANFAYNYGLFAHRGKPEKFSWFIYGSIIHKIADGIRTEVLVDKTVSPYMSKEDESKYFRKWFYLVKLAMDPEFCYQEKGECEEFIYIPRDSIQRMGMTAYRKLAGQKKETYLRKAWNTIKAVYYSTRIQARFTYSKYEWRFSSQKFRVENLHRPDNRIWLLGAFDDIHYMVDGSDLWYIIIDLKSGNKNNLKLRNNHQMLMYNFVARHIDHASPSKKDGPRMEHLSIFNHRPPREQYLVSLDVEPWLFTKHKHPEQILHSEDMKLLVEVNFDVEWPEHHKFISDVSTEQHYMLKEYDQNGNLFAPEEFEPLSVRGKQLDIGRSMREQRFVPRIGPHCGLCPAKQWCKEDHPDDWDQYRERHSLGVNYEEQDFIIDPGDIAIDVEDDGGVLLPDETYVSKYIPVQQTLDLSGRGGSKHNLFIPKTVPKRKMKEMEQLGFATVTGIAAKLKRMVHQLPFLEDGTKCQCMGFKNMILPEDEKIDLKLLSSPSALHQHMIDHCPLGDCLRRQEHQQRLKQEEN